MQPVIDTFMNQFGQFLLILSRVGALFISAPILGSSDIPIQLRIALVLLMSVLLVMVQPVPSPPSITSMAFLALIPMEIIAGALIGFAASLIFTGIQLAGNFIGLQIGFRFGSTVDPQAGDETSLISQFQYLVAALTFVILGGHRWILQGLARSYRSIPPGFVQFTPGVELKLMAMFGTIFTVAVQVSAPVLLSLLLASVALGIISRTVPQINIINIGFILKIGFGMTVMVFSMDYFGDLLLYLFRIYRRDILVLWTLFA